ncbi:hypothetical protein QYB59_002414 [Clostridium perfringens]|uniref:hypothetical protein n=1 Tax=Clostridium perfringens TaxID=1502 RepID=UPI0023668975|nr:hypothetical protein [Clostridium perfringens]ELC8443371.1 hypothetical protein [Clostridium perfringens]MDM0742976.1 hypothetical protein [Clostridium perfringens]
MPIKFIDIIENDIYEIKVSNKTIIINDNFLSLNIEYILFTSLNDYYQLKFFDIYENLKLSIPIFHNSTIEYNKNKISINTIKN